ncbi:hypothetical protein AUJ14_02550 [Candidatus Micrarchaeota archaeon CG1_02_55_22]|nr:MAG: hypothetical protein AUJ14_02550 [Candidatus Micrarchaeota archaeon CG1_02_55_22]
MAKATELVTIVSDLHTLDSKINLLAQKMRTIEKNEEVLGRTLIALNNRIKKIEEGGSTTRPSASSSGSTDGKALDLKYATKQELSEIRYVLDSINPLEYATVSQVRDLINEKFGDVKKTVASLKKDSEKEDSSATGMFEKI